MSRLIAVVRNWGVGDYIRQVSVVVIGVLITFLGSDLITENSRQKEVDGTMRLVTEELKYNRKELSEVKRLLDVDRYMAKMLIENEMNVSVIPKDTLMEYNTFFSKMSSFEYRTDALDVLKGSSLMQYISDKRLLQDVLQIYYKLGRIQKDINGYYQMKSDVIMEYSLSRPKNKSSILLFDNQDGYKSYIESLMADNGFFNFVVKTPGFLDWEDFDLLDRSLAKQIQILEKKYE